MQPLSVVLDPHAFSPDLEEILSKLRARTVGQDQAVEAFGRIFETFLAGYSDPDRPVGVVLEMGPTGVGKTWSLHPVPHQNTPARARDGPAHSQCRGVFSGGFPTGWTALVRLIFSSLFQQQSPAKANV